ncbi:MAG TPA: DUF1501 domain-containing protein, partial [Gemmataceae bacterium]|nr:DUF1501 domain-containing protein [Gemmataceae bacterium]
MDALKLVQEINRRHFLGRCGLGLGAMALGACEAASGSPTPPHYPARAKRVIYLFQSGAPSQMDLFDYKPALKEKRGLDLPDSVRMGQRITTMTSGQKKLPVAPSIFSFAQHGRSGAWLSELLPHTAR